MIEQNVMERNFATYVISHEEKLKSFGGGECSWTFSNSQMATLALIWCDGVGNRFLCVPDVVNGLSEASLLHEWQVL